MAGPQRKGGNPFYVDVNIAGTRGNAEGLQGATKNNIITALAGDPDGHTADLKAAGILSIRLRNQIRDR